MGHVPGAPLGSTNDFRSRVQNVQYDIFNYYCVEYRFSKLDSETIEVV